MATGLIGDKSGSRRRGPRLLKRAQGSGPRPARPGAPERARPARPPSLPPAPSARATLAPPVPAASAPDQASAPAWATTTATATATAAAAAARPQARPRTPFVLLLVGLLAGGLVCLLLINTTLAEGSFRINSMQRKNSALSQQVQSLQQQTAQEESPASIAARAQQLGMRPVGRLRFVNLKKGRIYSQPATEPGVIDVPGYTP